MPDRYATVGGVKVHYVEEGSGTPVVMMPGAAYNARTWVQVGLVKAVADAGFRAISVDPPGQGETPQGKYGFGGGLKFLEDFLPMVNFNAGVLLGASLGGNTVATYALAHPDKVLGLILVGAVDLVRHGPQFKMLTGKPILLIWGKHDDVSPIDNAEAVMSRVNTAELVRIGERHACYLDDPQGFVQTVVEFLKSRVTRA
ncbi:alpha/beta fold hydrolase [Acidilobus sp.]|uniref:alpha/beta fold hydrolase n=1 Tax=Acidilobus sp. TaxID=1872109 RepID=UPI003CFC6CAE